MTPIQIFDLIHSKILALQEKKLKPLRIAINGIEGSGKTTFANQLTLYLPSQKLTAIHVSIDGFHHNRSHRYRQGKDSAIGYYEDSYDEQIFVDRVLKSSQAESPNYLPASHDLETDQYLNLLPIFISNDSILITDAAYLFKPIYRSFWDIQIYLRTDFQTALERGVMRDMQLLGGYQAACEKYEKRYHAASRIYIEDNNPESLADIIIDNTDFENLICLRS